MVPQPGSDKGQSQGTKRIAVRVWFYRAERPGLALTCVLLPGQVTGRFFPLEPLVRALLERAEAP